MPKSNISKKFKFILPVLISILILSVVVYTFFNFSTKDTKINLSNLSSFQNSLPKNSQNLQENSKNTLQNIEIKNEKITLQNLQSKENKFLNWNEIKFAEKINKISDIPLEVMNQIITQNKIPNSVPAYGFRFYNGVAFWASGFDGIYTYDGKKITNLNTYNSGRMDNYISRLIENGKTFVYTNTTKNSISGGFFIDLQNGTWWTEKSIFTDEIREIITEKSVMEKYKKFDFEILKEPNGYNIEYFELYFNGKIYGKFTKTDEKSDEHGFVKSYIVEDDGIRPKILFENLGNGQLEINSRGNFVSFGIQLLDENDRYYPQIDEKTVESQKITITEQDFQTGKLLATQITNLNDLQAYKKFGIEEIGKKYLVEEKAKWQR